MNPNAEDVARSNFEKFSSREGAQHIATFSSQRNLAELIIRFDPKVILDWGSGIGTLISLASQLNQPRIYAYEESEFCISLAKSNLEGLDVQYLELGSIPSEVEAVFIDASLSQQNLKAILNCPNLKFIFVEGWRNSTVISISRTLPSFGYSAQYIRANGWLGHFTKGKTHEKAGAWFVMKKSNAGKAILSRISRIWASGELGEYFFRAFYSAASATHNMRHPERNKN